MGLSGKASDVEGKRHLVAALRMLAEWGFGFIIIFDADAATNEDVRAAERKLARQLAKFNVPVRSITGDWDAGPNGEFKGMDDFIQHKRIEEFRAILSKAKLRRNIQQQASQLAKLQKFIGANLLGNLSISSGDSMQRSTTDCGKLQQRNQFASLSTAI
jgi:putative DNA primase/helicase